MNKEVANDAIDGNLLIEEEHVECKPERIPDSVLDENVDISLICHYFSSDAWLLLDTVIKTKMKNVVWICHTCHHDLHREISIICDACLLWYHFQCVGLKAQPKGRQWFCRPCYSLAKK